MFTKPVPFKFQTSLISVVVSLCVLQLVRREGWWVAVRKLGLSGFPKKFELKPTYKSPYCRLEITVLLSGNY